MRKLFVFLILFLLLGVFTTSSSAWVVPDTGQTKCYIENLPGNPGRWIVGSCPQLGEPCYGQDAQYTFNPPSFTKLDSPGNDLPQDAESWATVRDNVTGLIWEVKANQDERTDYANPNDADNVYTWYDSNPDTNGGVPGTSGVGSDTEDFINALNSMQFGSFSDWRLPTAKEIALIFIRYKGISDWPFIDTDYFPNVKLDQYHTFCYWSSTTDPNSPSSAWAFDFADLNGMHDQEKRQSNCVRAVRGQSIDQNDFIDNGNGTVTDMSTGLMWQQDSLPYDWEGALAYCENLTLAGYSDWRLPNLNELLTLLDHANAGLVIDVNYFPSTAVTSYWSSTFQDSTERAWTVRFDFGRTHADNPQMNYYVRAVRGGSPVASPVAIAGPDQVVFDKVILDGTQSYDPIGTIVSYEWVLQHRGNSAYDRVAEGANPVVSDLAPDFYDVTLTVTDNDGTSGTDTMLLAAAGQCDSGPSAPTMSGICPAGAEPTAVVSLYGIGFGDTQGDSVVHIAGRTFDFTSSRIKVWSDTKIRIRIPFGAKPCEWFIHGDGQYRNRMVWVTVDGSDSNKKLLKVINPNICP